jgi:valyl-tRNA synthetase
MSTQAPPQLESPDRDYAPYDPAQVEARWYAEWMSRGYFKPRPNPGRKPFVINMPPPNVTGELHVGHALFVSIQDILIRWHRMLGDPTLWVPGRDHAGIAGQLVVERQLQAETGLTRQEIGREPFLDHVWDWMRTYGERIREQMYRLGTSADWDREAFTMDPGPSRAVRTAFVRLYDQGLIYKGNRITNWDPGLQTAVSDLEVEYRELNGNLWHVRYALAPVDGESEARFIEVATTRPETILADAGIAVHPSDQRYAGIIGRRAIIPHVGREIPIVADDAVDPAFGTGAVKVTPGHDPTDFEIGQRANLPTIVAMNLDGTMNEHAGRFAGMTTAEARKAFVDELEELGALVKVEPHRHAVAHSFRSGAVIEPIVTEQWYVKIEPLATPALEAVRDGHIRIIPDHFAKVYYNWMENIRDWCISRQLWWGHRIPVWYRDDGGPPIVSVDDPDPADYPGVTLTQDPDVLDTWFSSGLWPFSTLGWPDDTEDLRTYYPTTVMETGYDILFFWVARMIMQGIAMTGDIPFSEVYLHGMVRVEGEKMSKVKGNVRDPLELMAQYGTDAVRLGLVVGTTPGNDVSISDAKFEAQRNFANKLWNAGRFVLANVPPEADRNATSLSLADRWIRSRAEAATADATRLLADFQFGEAARVVQEFFWDEYCDWYLEMAKVQLRDAATAAATRATLVDVLDRVLLLLHPFAPFVTEEIWQSLAGLTDAASKDGPFRRPSIMISAWPEAGERDAMAESAIGGIVELVQALRRLKTDYGIGARWAPLVVEAGDRAGLLREHASQISALGRVEPLSIQETLSTQPPRALSVVAGGVRAFMPVEGLFDVAAETGRVERELAEGEGHVTRVRGQLSQPNFVNKAPPAVVEQRREQLAELEDRVAKLGDRFAALKALGA